jgi:hypothetical protein
MLLPGTILTHATTESGGQAEWSWPMTLAESGRANVWPNTILRTGLLDASTKGQMDM